jgi:hypothetical protein
MGKNLYQSVSGATINAGIGQQCKIISAALIAKGPGQIPPGLEILQLLT